ncbi:MAG: Maf family protein [Candidatus Hydrogenedentota bacterium]
MKLCSCRDIEFYASTSSPRRRELLKKHFKKIKFLFPKLSEGIESGSIKGIKDPVRLVKILSFLKAQSSIDLLKNKRTIVIGVDTIVFIDDKILGKPRDDKEAYRMLKILSGRVQRVYSGVTLYRVPEGSYEVFTDTSLVRFKVLDDNMIKKYIYLYKPFDKAGAYGVQETREEFIESIDGSYYNVMGFPLEKFIRVLKWFAKC